MSRPIPDEIALTPLQMAPNFYLHTLYYSVAFVAIMASISPIFGTLFPSWYKALNDKKREELPAYVTSMFHHFSVVPMAWYFIYMDYTSTIDCAQFVWFAAPFCTGFVIADTIFYAIPLCFRGNFEFALHHILAIWMVFTILSGSGHLIRFLAHIIICDTTNAVFNIAWFLRLSKYKDSVAVTICEVSFAVLFLNLRCINLSTVFGILFFSHLGEASYGFGRYVFPILSVMQFYWLYKILQATLQKVFPAKNKKVKSKNK